MRVAEEFVPDGQPLPREAVIVRGGESGIETMRSSAKKHCDYRLDEGLSAEYALSGEYRLGCTAQEIALRADAGPFAAGHYRHLRQSTAQRIVEEGFEVV